MPDVVFLKFIFEIFLLSESRHFHFFLCVFPKSIILFSVFLNQNVCVIKNVLRKRIHDVLGGFGELNFIKIKLKNLNLILLTESFFLLRNPMVNFSLTKVFLKILVSSSSSIVPEELNFFVILRNIFPAFPAFLGCLDLNFFIKKKKFSKIKIFIHIFRSVNNMFISVSAPKGRNLYSYSAGRTQFRGSKRLSPIAIETMGKTVSSLLYNSKIKKVAVVFHTPVDFLVRALLRGLKSTLNFSSFRYHLNKPHNGLRLRASRRILFIIFRMWCNGNISALGAGAVGSSPAIQIAV